MLSVMLVTLLQVTVMLMLKVFRDMLTLNMMLRMM